MRRLQRGLLLLVVGLLGAVVAAGFGASPAAAHAVVLSSSPSADERLNAPPAEASIEFSEGVNPELGGLTVLNSDGDRVDNDDTSQPSITSLRTTLQPDLGDGTYVINYKVISADGHPVSGAVVFGIGNAQLGDVSGLAQTSDPTGERIATVARFLTYVAGLLAAGLVAFTVFVHDGASDRRALAHVVQIATIVAAFGAVFTIAAQAALATGRGLGAFTELETLRGVLRQGMGWSTAVLFLGLAACHVAATTRRPMLMQGLTLYGALAVTTSFAFWGHAVEAPNALVAVVADVVHVAVAALWFGGLVGLTMTLTTRSRAARAAGLVEPTLLVGSAAPAGVASASTTAPADEPRASSTSTAVLDRPEPLGDDLEPSEGSLGSTVAIVRTFSAMAAASVALLAVSGAALAWQEVGSVDALISTSYGQTLLVKLALVAVIVLLAAYNRFLLLPWLLAHDPAHAPGHRPAEDAPRDDATDDDATDDSAPAGADDGSRHQIDEGLEAGWRSLVRSVTGEALVLVAVLAVTAVLVNIVPGRSEAVPRGPFVATEALGDGTVTLTVTPNQPGVNSFHIDLLGPDGRPADLAQKVTLELLLPAKDIGPLERETVKAGVGHFLLEGISDLAIPGDWQITLNIRVADFDQTRVTFTDTIG